MPAHMRRAIWLLGLCQCVLWGVLYYSFSVLLVPIETELRLSRTAVAGAFSLGLGAMAVAAPQVGRWLDAGRAAHLTRLGVALAVLGLLLVAAARDAAGLYLGWFCIGLAMAKLLYEPAFALVIRAVSDEGHRLRALAAVTVFGGLASTLFLPLLSVAVGHGGWRMALMFCAVAVLIAAWILERHVVPALPAAQDSPGLTASSERRYGGSKPPYLLTLIAIFASGTLASMSLTTLLIPLLLERGSPASVAALVLAALGVAQLPGRIWLLRGRKQAPGVAMSILPIGLQVAGLLGVVVSSSPTWTGVAVAIFGVGAGLQTLARPWIVQALYGSAEAGRWNGEVARMQGFARAAGPVAIAGAAGLTSTQSVLAGVGVALALTVPLARRLPLES